MALTNAAAALACGATAGTLVLLLASEPRVAAILAVAGIVLLVFLYLAFRSCVVGLDTESLG